MVRNVLENLVDPTVGVSPGVEYQFQIALNQVIDMVSCQ